MEAACQGFSAAEVPAILTALPIRGGLPLQR